MHLKSQPVHSSKQLEMFTLDTWMNNLDTSSFISFEVHNVNKPKRQYKKKKILFICSKFLHERYSGFYKIYSDASKDKQGIGAAFLDIQTKEFIKLNVNNLQISIMHAELIGIAESLSYIRSINKDINFVIFTDAKSALHHLVRCTQMARGIPLAYYIISTLSELNTINKKVILQWIPSHIGLIGNESVDKLAREAAVDGIDFNCLPYYTNFMGAVKEFSNKLWSEYFDKRSLTKGIWYRTMQPALPQVPWFEKCNMGRYDIVTSFRLRSGHIPLNKFGFLMGKVNSSKCTECDIVEDVYHILMECVRNEAFRYSILQGAVSPFDVGWCNSVLSFPLSEDAKLLYKLTHIGIKNRSP